jgi:type IV secretory pathway ATPase VirB11/archaellum biosynthesis ATPase
VRRLRFKGPHFLISGATGAGTPELVQAIMTFLEQNQRAAEDEAAAEAAADAAKKG